MRGPRRRTETRPYSLDCLPSGFFLPVGVLSRLFRRLFLQALQSAFSQGQLQLWGEREALRDPTRFSAYLEPLRRQEWVVYAKPPFGGPQQVLAYWGRYTHRVAISNQRLLAAGNTTVTFQWKDYRAHGPHPSRRMSLDADEFIPRFLIHTLPDRWQRIRHCGYLANRHRKHHLELCRRLLATPVSELLPPAAQCLAVLAALPLPQLRRCPVCAIGTMVRVQILPAYSWPAQPPDTS